MVSYVLILFGFKECMDYMNTILFVFLCKTVEEIGALKLCSSLKNMCGYCFHGSLVKLKQVVYDIVLVVFVSEQFCVPELHFDDLGVGGQWNCTLDKKYTDLSVLSSALQIKVHAFVGFHDSVVEGVCCGWLKYLTSSLYIWFMFLQILLVCIHCIYWSSNRKYVHGNHVWLAVAKSLINIGLIFL